MNKVFLIGNLTRDPELSQLPSGVSVCKFGLAVNRNFTNSSGEREVDFFNITAWRGLGENCAKYLSKGRKVSVVGNRFVITRTRTATSARLSTSLRRTSSSFRATTTETLRAAVPAAGTTAAAERRENRCPSLRPSTTKTCRSKIFKGV